MSGTQTPTNRQAAAALSLKQRTRGPLTAVLFIILLTGCADALLDQPPRGPLTLDGFFQTEAHALEATNATYAKLRDGNVHGHLWLGMTEATSDNANKGSTPADGPPIIELENFSFPPSNNAFLQTWTGYYEGIFRANFALVNIPDVEMDDGLKQRLIAENKFLRAYFYFFLVRAYGGVPLITEPQEPGEFRVPRATTEEVYVQIEQDLQDAAEVLPLKSEYPASDMGRITKGAAQGLLARVYLFQQRYTEAEQLAREVINSGEYSLYPDYEGIFQPQGENSTESVFEVQAVAVEPPQGGTPYSQPQGVRGQPNLGWGFYGPTDDLLATYEPGDPRLGATVLFVHETLPYGPVDVVRHNVQMLPNQRYNQKPFVPLDQPGGAASGNGGSNIRILRYADVLLIAAEAAYHNGNETDARQWVNSVRQRARHGHSATPGFEAEALAGLVADTLGNSSVAGRPFARYVSAGGPAAAAGLRAMEWNVTSNILIFDNVDIIQSIDGVNVSGIQAYSDEMSQKSPGQEVTLSVLRISESAGSPKSRSTENLEFTINAADLLPDITSSGQQLLEDIWHERRIELAMEHHRFFDLVRTGQAGEVLRAFGKTFEDSKHELFPIPLEELQLNPELTQNPGY